MLYIFDKLKTEKIAILTETKTEFDNMVEKAIEHGFITTEIENWRETWDKYIDTDGGPICVEFYDGFNFDSSVSFTTDGYTIIKPDQIIWKEKSDKITIQQFCYDMYMDNECMKICNYLNSLPNIETSSSCCGHGKTSFEVVFKVSNNRGTSGLSLLGRCIDKRYGGNNSVQIRLVNTDTNYNHTCYLLTTTDLKGKEAYETIENLCNVIDEHIKNEDYLHAFNIVTYK